MNKSKKRLLFAISLVAMIMLLAGCSNAGFNEDGSPVLITLDTTFGEMLDEGITSAIFTYPIAQILNLLVPKVGVGLAITIVTVVINLIILGATFKSNLSMQRMQDLQPELEKIQRKYEGKDDENSKQRQAMEMQRLYEKYDVNPIGALLTTFIQLPILIAMYNAVRRCEAVVKGTFFGAHLSTTPLEAVTSGQIVLIVIYVLMILCQLLSVKFPQMLQRRRAEAEANKHHKSYKAPEQNFFMTYGMVVLIAVMMINWPTGLSLYYCITSLVNVAKTWWMDKIAHKDDVVNDNKEIEK